MAKEQTSKRIYQRVSHFIFEEVRLQSKIPLKILYLCRLLILSIRSFVIDLCPQRAAALAFTTTLSLVPLIALLVLYFKMAGKLEALSVTIQDWILNTFVAAAAQNVSVYLDHFVNNIHTKALGALGASGLILSIYFNFRTIEHSINDIWKIRKHRSFFARFQILSSVLIIVPALMITSIYFSGKFQGIKLFSQNQIFSMYTRSVFLALPFLFTFATFFMIFKLLPNTNVRILPALVATTISSTLFEAAKIGFSSYVVHILSVSKIYGALGFIPILLVWIYLSWLIILIGVEISYVIQNYDILYEETLERLRVDPLDVAVHEEWGLKIFKSLKTHFQEKNGAIPASNIASDLGIRTSHVLNHLDILVEGGLVAEVDVGGEPYYIFTSPVDSIVNQQVVNLFRKKLNLPVLQPVS